MNYKVQFFTGLFGTPKNIIKKRKRSVTFNYTGIIRKTEQSEVTDRWNAADRL